MSMFSCFSYNFLFFGITLEVEGFTSLESEVGGWLRSPSTSSRLTLLPGMIFTSVLFCLGLGVWSCLRLRRSSLKFIIDSFSGLFKVVNILVFICSTRTFLLSIPPCDVLGIILQNHDQGDSP